MPLRKHFAFRKNGRVYINQAAYAALQQEGTRLQSKKNLARDKAILAAQTDEMRWMQIVEREQAQLRALTEFLEAHGARNQAALPPPQPRPVPAIPPVVDIMRGLPNSFRKGIPLLLSRFQEIGEIVPVAIFHSRKHARKSKSKLQAVAAFGGNAPSPAVARPVTRTVDFQHYLDYFGALNTGQP